MAQNGYGSGYGGYSVYDSGYNPVRTGFGTPTPMDPSAPGVPDYLNPPNQPGGNLGQGFQRFDFFGSQPGDVVFRAMRQMGLDPTLPDMRTKAILRHADDIYYTALARAAQNGTMEQSLTQDNPQMMMDLVKGILGTRGSNPFAGMGAGAVNALSGLANNFFAGSDNSRTAAVLATLLSDPNRAVNVASSLLYGGQPRTVAGILSAPLAKLPDIFTEGVEQDRYGQGGTEGVFTALQLLNRLRGGMYGAFGQ